MSAARRAAGLAASAVALGIAGAALAAPACADDADTASAQRPARSAAQPAQRGHPSSAARGSRGVRAERPVPVASGRGSAARTTPVVTVDVALPPVPVADGWSFRVSRDAVAGRARDYVAAGGDPADAPRFFFGDLAVASLDTLASPDLTTEQQRTQLGNLAVSGYFGGVWLRDNLRAPAPSVLAVTDPPVPADPPFDPIAAIGIRLFDALAAGLTQAAASRNPWIVTTAAHLSVPVLLTLYGYNRGYLDYLLDHPPAGVASMQQSLSCSGFLACSSDAFPLEMADRYDTALEKLASPPSLGWAEMAAWSSVLEIATGAGKFVWSLIGAGGFSPTSYQALVELSSAYLMVSKAAVLSAMTAAADGDAATGRSSLRLQAGLWMWSGAYFGGLASTAPAGTLPAIVVG